jgi:hypothetical protein
MPGWPETKMLVPSMEFLAGEDKEGLGNDERTMDSWNKNIDSVEEIERNLRVVTVSAGDAGDGRKTSLKVRRKRR